MATRADGGLNRAIYQDSAMPVVLGLRSRFTIAQINAGATILAAITGFRYRLIDAYAIAVGGAVAAVTTIDILGTVAAGAVKLVAFGQAALTQSAMVRAGSAGGVILADGASFVQLDASTAITIGKTGAAITTATHVDVYTAFMVDDA